MLGLRVGFISSHLTADKLFQVNRRMITGPPKMSLLLEAKSMPALIIKPKLIRVTHTDDLGWYITSNLQGQMFVQNLGMIVSKPNVTTLQIPYCTTDSITIDLMFQENLPTHRQVWNCLSHRNDCWQRGVIWVTYRCYNSNRSGTGTSVIRQSSVPPHAWVGLPTNWSQLETVAKSKAATPWLFMVIAVEPNHKDDLWFDNQCRHAFSLKQKAHLRWTCDCSRVTSIHRHSGV